MTKVLLPKDVAQAIEHYRNKGFNDASIIVIAGTSGGIAEHAYSLVNFVISDVNNSDVLMSALVNGYEVERTPEDELREFYEANKEEEDISETAAARVYAIEFTLKSLGIKVEGINA